MIWMTLYVHSGGGVCRAGKALRRTHALDCAMERQRTSLN